MTNRSLDAVCAAAVPGAARVIPFAVLVLAFGLLAACNNPPPARDGGGDDDDATVEDPDAGPLGPSYGEPCDDESQCRDDAPTCTPFEAAAYSPGICTHPCEGTDETCEAGSECHEGACVRCVSSVAGTIGSGGDCACDGDCESGTCFFGTCSGNCMTTGCEDGFACEGTPPMCRECLGGGPFPETGTCGCNADCDSGLECLGGFCLRACQFDEMCGADQCQHELGVPPSCTAIPACVGAGDGAPGAECLCNLDCGFDAPFCTGVFVEGSRSSFCSVPCSVKEPCPSGTQCCSTVPGNLYCLPDAVAAAAGATCS